MWGGFGVVWGFLRHQGPKLAILEGEFAWHTPHAGGGLPATGCTLRQTLLVLVQTSRGPGTTNSKGGSAAGNGHLFPRPSWAFRSASQAAPASPYNCQQKGAKGCLAGMRDVMARSRAKWDRPRRARGHMPPNSCPLPPTTVRGHQPCVGRYSSPGIGGGGRILLCVSEVVQSESGGD